MSKFMIIFVSTFLSVERELYHPEFRALSNPLILSRLVLMISSGLLKCLWLPAIQQNIAPPPYSTIVFELIASAGTHNVCVERWLKNTEGFIFFSSQACRRFDHSTVDRTLPPTAIFTGVYPSQACSFLRPAKALHQALPWRGL